LNPVEVTNKCKPHKKKRQVHLSVFFYGVCIFKAELCGCRVAKSSRGHLRKQKAFQSQIETAFHLDYGAHSGYVIQSQNFNSDSNSIAIETAFHLDYGAHSGHVIQSQNFNSDSNSIAIETAFHLDYGAHSG